MCFHKCIFGNSLNSSFKPCLLLLNPRKSQEKVHLYPSVSLPDNQIQRVNLYFYSSKTINTHKIMKITIRNNEIWFNTKTIFNWQVLGFWHGSKELPQVSTLRKISKFFLNVNAEWSFSQSYQRNLKTCYDGKIWSKKC